MKLNWNFQVGGGDAKQLKKPSVGGVWYFWRRTIGLEVSTMRM